MPQWLESKPDENVKVVLFEDLVRHVNDEIFVQTDFLNLTFVEK